MTDNSLRTLFKPIREEMEEFSAEFQLALRSDVTLIQQMMGYILRQESKRLRPALLIFSAKLCGAPNRLTNISAIIVEILHTATLIHDDIVDDSQTRHGVLTVNAIWKNKVSVLLGDYLFSKSLSKMLAIRDFQTLELLSETSELLSSGEIFQIEKSLTDGMDERDYYRMIWAKTASLFATSCKIGAISVEADEKKANSLFEYGKNLGMAFQIKDDLFDFTSKEKHIGKPIGRDIKANLITLPMIYALNALSSDQKNKLKTNLRDGLSINEIEEARSLVRVTGGLDYAETKMHEFSKLAERALDIFPDSDVKNSMRGLIIFNEQRKS